MARKDTNQIEKMAIAKLNEVLLRCDAIDPYISQNDKTPSFDGQLFIYSGSKVKKNILGEISVQVKGTEKVLHDATCKFPIKLADLNNFRNNNGCIFFLVSLDFDRNEFKVYYEALQVLDLNRIIDKTKNQETTSVELKEFPQDDPVEITNICINFVNDSKKQRSFIDNTPTLEELLSQGAEINGIVMSGTVQGMPAYDVDRYITTHPVYMYAKPKNLNVELPIGKIENAVIKRDLNFPVSVKNRQYYNSYSLVTEGGVRKMILGESITLKIDSVTSKISVNMHLPTRLSDLIKDLEFYVDMINSRNITINGASIDLGEYSEDANEFQTKLDYYRDVQVVLEKLGVTEELDCSKLTDRDNKNLYNFVNSILYGCKLSFPGMDKNVTHGLFSIANLRIMIWINRHGDGFCDVSDFFDSHPVVCFREDDKDNHNPIQVSQFLLLTEEALSEASNLDCDRVYNDIIEKGNDLEYVGRVQVFMLQVLKAYDLNIKHQEELLTLAQQLCGWISTIYTEDYLQTLNLLQIIKRQRSLNTDEMSELNHILKTTGEISVKCGAYILLDDYSNALKCLDELSEKDKEEFIAYPIYRFVQLHQQGGKI